MAKIDFSEKTVIELRKIAKEYGVKLGAGISKAGIIAKLEDAIGEEVAPAAPQVNEAELIDRQVAEALAASEAAEKEEAEDEVPAMALEELIPARTQEETAPAAPQGGMQFRAAWHNPSQQRFNRRPQVASPARPSFGPQSVPGGAEPIRPQQPARPVHRFGPDAAVEQPMADQPRNAWNERRSYDEPGRYGRSFGPQSEPMRPAPQPVQPVSYEPAPVDPTPAPQSELFQPVQPRPAAPQPVCSQPAPEPQQRSYSPRPQQEYNRPAYNNQGGYNRPNTYGQRRDNYYNNAPQSQPQQMPNPATVSELLQTGEYKDGEGLLEIHLDGYGFLRADTMMPSSRDIYISVAQIRRFNLRSGDRVRGKIRPQREDDRFAAMLYITSINGLTPEEMVERPSFTDLTPVHATRRINMNIPEGSRYDAMRLIDLVAPLGFGHRVLFFCPAAVPRSNVIRDFTNVLCDSYPEATVLVLLLDEMPEDVTAFRDQVRCHVLASTFDQPPEHHIRLVDMVLERSQRLVEMGKDVIIVIDSLTSLSKTFTSSSVAPGAKMMPGTVNPASLFRAKKMFGAARCLKEGGSLTVIGIMDTETGSKVDDATIEEFRPIANSMLTFSSELMRENLMPPIELRLTGTRRADMLLDAHQQESLRLLRTLIKKVPSRELLPQILDMLRATPNTDDFRERLKEWMKLMKMDV